ncbi:L-serine ammonia-lyase [Micromonospora noduli]|uniref:L-serine dehydratase n=1 Tax=Micromonospora noduli TaxID=709876 RepID=A0ABX9D5W9_9ACTN|nr:L-serine ammonia-lyase [Micromonospora noduli]KAB1927777.1 L-serine ammonia-lyase [Micromonospora noduli]RAO21026.1 L-serine ammonia-lyase [Micromonospora noduli]RAO21329.1 L-serine ammonia-lyase [Micromonospora noduli]RAO28565.1 L-serine ammonia-lyase [Micromonospora noduli]RAO58087.1 L-serine ammonia-lyase [Micromonospora noduli]
MISVFDLFSVGIGPSSSHTVGPMRAARTFVGGLKADGLLSDTARVQAELFGSLGATGHGHGSGPAVLLGLAGESPETVDTDTVGPRVERIRAERRLNILDAHEIDFDPDRDLTLHRRRSLPYHPNGMTFVAYDGAGAELRSRTYYSVGGGFVVDEAAAGADRIKPDSTVVRYPFLTGAQLLDVTTRTGLSISEVMLANERSWRSEADIRAGLLEIWRVMQECVQRGCERDGVLPGGLKVRRRAAELRRGLEAEAGTADPLHAMDWVTLFALAVNEENAAGGRVVTAPTNGAAGIIPAVLHYYTRFVPDADDEGVVRFLLTAGAIGVLFKENASISGAEVGCQGEVGSACSMAAAGLAEALGGTPEQVENAAEIGMEHNLGLTCDPVGGLVQIPCIERNAVASIKAITAARLALRGDGVHKVSLDKVIKTMRETGADMKVKYKETARGGLAVNVIEC